MPVLRLAPELLQDMAVGIADAVAEAYLAEAGVGFDGELLLPNPPKKVKKKVGGVCCWMGLLSLSVTAGASPCHG